MEKKHVFTLGIFCVVRVPVFLLASYSEYNGSVVNIVFYVTSSFAFLAFATVKVRYQIPKRMYPSLEERVLGTMKKVRQIGQSARHFQIKSNQKSFISSIRNNKYLIIKR